MAMITLQNSSMTEVTVLSNTFIDNYMPEANGEFVKVYIYLLRSLSNAPVSFSLEQMADRLLCTERDILRALKYWAKQELLVLDFTDSDKLCGIALLSPDKHTETASSVSASVETVSTVEQPAVQAASAPSATAEPSVTTGKASSDKKQELTPERIRAEEGITTVEQAKRSNSRYNKEYFTILKALGITNRNPVETEITLMDTWLKTYCFSMEIIQEACNRTVLQTGQASFQYTDKILEGWKKKEVKTLDDIRSLDDEHQKRRQSRKAAARKPAAPASNNRFNNFEQREYDFSEYEKHLLNQ